MAKFGRYLNRGECLKPTKIALLDEPLEFIHEDHLRERQICALIDEIAHEETLDVAAVWDVHSFLNKELPLHLQDEDEDLFPLLRSRCEREDEIDKVINKLKSDHTHAEGDTPKVVAVLEGLAAQKRPPIDQERKLLLDYSSHSRRHLILENAIILPFARLRLTQKDRETLCVRMCQRRGLDSLGDLGNVG